MVQLHSAMRNAGQASTEGKNIREHTTEIKINLIMNVKIFVAIYCDICNLQLFLHFPHSIHEWIYLWPVLPYFLMYAAWSAANLVDIADFPTVPHLTDTNPTEEVLGAGAGVGAGEAGATTGGGTSFVTTGRGAGTGVGATGAETTGAGAAGASFLGAGTLST